MKPLTVLLFALALSTSSLAFDKAEKMDAGLMEFLMQTLHGSKPHPNLRCEVLVREIRQARKFSTGTKWVEMIELEYRNDRDYDGVPMKTYYPLGSKVTRKQVNSEFAGVVEEIVIEADDRLNKTFTFHHDGRGQIVWMMMHDELRVNPCLLRRR